MYVDPSYLMLHYKDLEMPGSLIVEPNCIFRSTVINMFTTIRRDKLNAKQPDIDAWLFTTMIVKWRL